MAKKGGVENANGRLRRWLPRHLDIDRLSDEDIQTTEATITEHPKKDAPAMPGGGMGGMDF